MSININNDILVSGMTRSGTTLMYSALNAHPEISLDIDTLKWYWSNCYSHYGDLNNEYELDRAIYELEPYIRHYQLPDRDELDLKKIKEKTIQKGISYLNFYYSFLEELLKENIRPNWGIKSAQLTYDYQKFLNCVPNPFIIHMIRDPRDVYYSHVLMYPPKKRSGSYPFGGVYRYLKQTKDQLARQLIGKKILVDDRLFYPYILKDKFKIIDEWANTSKIALALQDKYPDQFMIIRYEDFVNDPGEVLRKILGKMKIEWVENFYNYSKLKDRDGKKFEWNTSYDKEPGRGYSNKHIGKSLRFLNEKERDYCQQVAGQVAKRFQYF